MSKKTITVTVDLDGKVELSADGYRGKSCVEATKFLEEALGLDTSGRKKTPDFFASETVKQSQTT